MISISWYAVGRMCLDRCEMILFLSCRAQDQASMQLSEMEEEMDQRIHAAERKTREQVGEMQKHNFWMLKYPLHCSSGVLCHRSDKQGAFVQLFPHVKQTNAAEYQITDELRHA